MRRLIPIVAVCVALCGCWSSNGIQKDGLNARADNRFEYESLASGADKWLFGYVVDSQTGVTYLVFEDYEGKNSIGGITPLLNRDGTPVIDGRYE